MENGPFEDVFPLRNGDMQYSIATVDGWNPAPHGMYKTFQIMG